MTPVRNINNNFNTHILTTLDFLPISVTCKSFPGAKSEYSDINITLKYISPVSCVHKTSEIIYLPTSPQIPTFKISQISYFQYKRPLEKTNTKKSKK